MIKSTLYDRHHLGQQAAVNDEPLIVMAGALRSGTTLLRLMLDGHSNISCPGEFDFVVDAIEQVGTDRDVDDYCDFLQASRIFRDYEFKIPNTDSFKQFVMSLCDQVRDAADKLVLPIHRHFKHTASLFPNAKYIHLVRDPRDVAYSVMQMGWAGNVWHGVKPWLDTEEDWREFKVGIDSSRVIDIRFEDVVASPEKTLQRLCEFLEVPFAESMLDVDTRSTYKRPDATVASKWRNRSGALESGEVELIEARVGPLLSDLGYMPEYQNPRGPSAVGRIRLSTKDRLGRLRFNADRYGLSTILGEKLTRWMSLRETHAVIRQRIDRIESTYLK